MSASRTPTFVIDREESILITGATGFIGQRVVASLLNLGFRNITCLVRPSSPEAKTAALTDRNVKIVVGNLLSAEDCRMVTRDAAVIIHLAAGTGQKSFADAFMNSVVTTKRLIHAAGAHSGVRRFVSVSSLAVYSSQQLHGKPLDETSAVEPRPESRADAYCYAKVKQDEVVIKECQQERIPYVIVRPAYVYGPGRSSIPSRVGIDTFGIFVHLGGSNTVPLTYVDNCADAIALAAVTAGIDGEIFNVVDDDLPSSRAFLRAYKRNVRRFHSLYVPQWLSYLFCYAWERYSRWATGQLEPVFNIARWRAYWTSAKYSNAKLKARTGWTPCLPTKQALQRYFDSCRIGA